MKKNFEIAAVFVSVLALGACGQAPKQEASKTAALRSGSLSADSGPASFRFSLADYISQSQRTSALAPYASNGTLLLGNKQALAVENNFIAEGSTATGNISSNYFLQGYTFNTPYSIVDARIMAVQKPLGGSYSIRTFGNTVKEGSLTTEFNFQTMRDYTVAIPAFALNAVGFYGEGGVGGEVSLKGEPQLDAARRSLGITLIPAAALFSKLELGASVVAGLARAGIQGNVKLFEAEMPVFAELGTNPINRPFGIFEASAMDVGGLGGTLSAVVTVGVNSLLPGSMQNLWRKYLEKTWKWDVLTIEAMSATPIPATRMVFGKDK